ncbi:hypothetical protein [Acetobacter orientalis]|nr:hypothetical protein [Acetobacter orientalis]
MLSVGASLGATLVGKAGCIQKWRGYHGGRRAIKQAFIPVRRGTPLTS